MAVGCAGAAFQYFSYFCCSRNITNTMRFNIGLQIGTQRAQCRAGNTHHGILVWQPYTANYLSPQSLFFDDLAGRIMDGAVLPERPHPLITPDQDLLLAESGLSARCDSEFHRKQQCQRLRSLPTTLLCHRQSDSEFFQRLHDNSP